MNTLSTIKKEPSLFSTFESIFGNPILFDNMGIHDNNFIYENTEDGGILSINAAGHNPENIDIEIVNGKLVVKSELKERSSPLVFNLDYKFKLTDKFSTENIKAEFEHGLIKIKFGIKEEVKPKKLKLKY